MSNDHREVHPYPDHSCRHDAAGKAQLTPARLNDLAFQRRKNGVTALESVPTNNEPISAQGPAIDGAGEGKRGSSVGGGTIG